MIEIIAEIFFYVLAGAAGLYSIALMVALLRFGKSKLLGLVVSALYLAIFLSLGAAALANFNKISFPQI